MEHAVKGKALAEVFNVYAETLFCPYCYWELQKYDGIDFLFCPNENCPSEVEYNLKGEPKK